MCLSSLSHSTTDSEDTKEFWVNMPNLMSHLKKVAEQKPQATYYNVDMIKYQVAIYCIYCILYIISIYLSDMSCVSVCARCRQRGSSPLL